MSAGHVEEAALEAALAGIRGEVVRKGEPGWDEARRVWNGMIDRAPEAIVRCTGTADVVAALGWAREQGLPVSVRAGGHNVAGTAVVERGVVLDLGGMRSVRVDLERRTVRAGGGARLGDVDHETQAHGLATPLGVVSRTGVAGLTLHGGMGFLTRRLGLSCDNLVSADVVTADGELLHVDAERHPDLLWALRGGGGNFGVVTSFEYLLHDVGPEVFMVITLYPAAAGEELLLAFRDAMAQAPDELMALAIFWSAPHEEPVPPEWQGQPVFVAAGCWSGALDVAEEAVRPLRELGEPVVDMSGPMPFAVAQQLFDPEYPDGRRYYWKSIYLSELDAEAAALCARAADGRPSPLSSIDVWALGGALRREPEGGSAFSGRDKPFLVGLEANWDDPGEDDANLAWARDLYQALHEREPAGAYLNFPGFADEAAGLLRASFGASWDRLREVKARYDPENVFSSTLNIPPA
ncbi:MAG TPA: FAD-binding oxidoreductase [Gaiellaceae bacterium]|nr:FAD-binding oxidoreductase [Gaiellaceae bacterium]